MMLSGIFLLIYIREVYMHIQFLLTAQCVNWFFYVVFLFYWTFLHIFFLYSFDLHTHVRELIIFFFYHLLFLSRSRRIDSIRLFIACFPSDTAHIFQFQEKAHNFSFILSSHLIVAAAAADFFFVSVTFHSVACSALIYSVT